EDDQPVAWRRDLVAYDPKLGSDAKGGDLLLDQALGGLRQRFLHFAHADRARPRPEQTALDQHLAEEMRLAGAAPAKGALVARRFQQRLEHPCRIDPEAKSFRRIQSRKFLSS